ncbi:APT4 [Symbiodinium microadriaticum]|nr:APT4 [Symbiodinium microadriaticum]CAE7226080.1 APT4 [Symbiodinium sp. KB8]
MAPRDKERHSANPRSSVRQPEKKSGGGGKYTIGKAGDERWGAVLKREDPNYDPEEKRVDPEDGCAYTWDELAEFYRGKYKMKQLEEYWDYECKPAKTRSSQRKAQSAQAGKDPTPAESAKQGKKVAAKPKAKSKAKPKAEAKRLQQGDMESDGPLAKEIALHIPYFPFKKIERFYDIQGLLQHPKLLNAMCAVWAKRFRKMGVTKICGFEARGFLFTPVSIKLGVPFVMLRKAGKLPNTISSGPYTKEYDGLDEMCVQKGAVVKGDKVVLIDDLIATGGTLCAGIKLMEACEAEVVECSCMVELKALKGREKCLAAGAKSVWGYISEELLTTKAELPDNYVDDGFAAPWAVEQKQVAQQQAERARYMVLKAQEEKKRTIIHAEGEKESARMIGDAIKANPGFVELRKISVAKEISSLLSKSANRMVLSTESLLMSLSDDNDGKDMSEYQEWLQSINIGHGHAMSARPTQLHSEIPSQEYLGIMLYEEFAQRPEKQIGPAAIAIQRELIGEGIALDEVVANKRSSGWAVRQRQAQRNDLGHFCYGCGQPLRDLNEEVTVWTGAAIYRRFHPACAASYVLRADGQSAVDRSRDRLRDDVVEGYADAWRAPRPVRPVEAARQWLLSEDQRAWGSLRGDLFTTVTVNENGKKKAVPGLSHEQLRILQTKHRWQPVSPDLREGQESEHLECAVCFGAPDASSCCIRLPCAPQHVFHLSCVLPWLKKASLCPTCRRDLRPLLK